MGNTQQKTIPAPEIISVSLNTGDEALIINGRTVYYREPSDRGRSVAEIAHNLVPALLVSVQEVAMPAPKLDDWTWDDVYDLIKQMGKKGILLSSCGIRFYQDGKNWLWAHDSVGDSAEGPYETHKQAEDSAWFYLAAAVMAEENMSDEDWEKLSESGQTQLISNYLRVATN